MKPEKYTDDVIAEFMRNHAINSPHIRKPDYSSNWNEMMLVIEKITTLYSLAFPPTDKFIKLIREGKDPVDRHYTDVLSLSISTPIHEVREAVIKFIEWYKNDNHCNP